MRNHQCNKKESTIGNKSLQQVENYDKVKIRDRQLQNQSKINKK